MKILMIGGTTFIGPYVVQSLAEKGCAIALFHRGQTSYPFASPVEHIIGNRQDLAAYASAFKKFSPDVVIDMIAFSRQESELLVNVLGGIVKRFVVISSVDVYRARDRLWKVITGPLESTPLKEEAPLRESDFPCRTPTSQPGSWEYSYDKRHVEEVLSKTVNLNSAILRLPAIYGPRDPYSRVGEYLLRLDSQDPIFLDETKSNWCFCRGYVENIAEAITLAALDERPGKPVYNVGERKPLTERAWIEAIAQAAGRSPKIVSVTREALTKSLQEPLDFSQDLTVDSTLIRKKLGYEEQVSVEEGLRRSIAWVRAQ